MLSQGPTNFIFVTKVASKITSKCRPGVKNNQHVKFFDQRDSEGRGADAGRRMMRLTKWENPPAAIGCTVLSNARERLFLIQISVQCG